MQQFNASTTDGLPVIELVPLEQGNRINYEAGCRAGPRLSVRPSSGARRERRSGIDEKTEKDSQQQNPDSPIEGHLRSEQCWSGREALTRRGHARSRILRSPARTTPLRAEILCMCTLHAPPTTTRLSPRAPCSQREASNYTDPAVCDGRAGQRAGMQATDRPSHAPRCWQKPELLLHHRPATRASERTGGEHCTRVRPLHRGTLSICDGAPPQPR